MFLLTLKILQKWFLDLILISIKSLFSFKNAGFSKNRYFCVFCTSFINTLYFFKNNLMKIANNSATKKPMPENKKYSIVGLSSYHSNCSCFFNYFGLRNDSGFCDRSIRFTSNKNSYNLFIYVKIFYFTIQQLSLSIGKSNKS